ESLRSSGSGRNRKELRVYSSYGDERGRPVVSPPLGEDGFRITSAGDSYVAIVGLKFVAPEGGTGNTGMKIMSDCGESFLIEDCFVHGFKDNIALFGKESHGGLRDVVVRRTIVVDAAAPFGGHSQGLYADTVDGLLIDECIFDHNGWSTELPGCDPTIFNHNIYLQSTCGPAAVRDTISARASSHGLQMRPGGLAEGNLFLANSLGMYTSRTESVIKRNVVLEGTDLDEHTPRGLGIEALSCENAIVVDNIVAQRATDSVGGYALQVNKSNNGIEYFRAVFDSNIVWDWGEQAFRVHINDNSRYDEILVYNNIFQDPRGLGPLVAHVPSEFDSTRFEYQGNTYWNGARREGWMSHGNSSRTYAEWLDISGERGSQNREVKFPDPNRTIGDYHQSLGGHPSSESFLRSCRELSKANWNPDLTAPRVVTWIRAGFGRE
ncbi:MAG: hypothetical protein ACOC0P_04760, partial [Planctomycetota bacterium]